MKNLFYLLILCSILTFFSCRQTSIVAPSCEELRVGTVCFDNNTDDAIRIFIDRNEADILPFSEVCFEMREGSYSYKGKRNLKRWRGDVFVETCRTVGVGLF